MSSDDFFGMNKIEDYTDKSTYDGMDHFNDYVKQFEEVCYNSPLVAKITYHILLGQLLKDIFIRRGGDEIDLRIHAIVIGPSGSGKSKSGYFLESVGTGAGLNTLRVTDFTDSGLLGSFEAPRGRDGEAHKNEGVLETADIVFADEARILFKETTHNKKALMCLQTGMNTIGQNRLIKVMRYGIINFIPTFSMYSLTTPIRNIQEFINYGFFQRQIILFDAENLDKRITNLNTDIDKVNFELDKDELFIFQEGMREIKRRLGRGFIDIKNFAVSNKIEESEDVKDEIRKSMKTLMGIARSIYNPHVKEIAISFVSRVLENMYKLAVHSTLMNKRISVTVDDVKYAYDLLLECFRTMIRYLEEHVRVFYRDEVLDKSRKASLVRLLLEHKEMRSGELVKKLMTLWENSKPTCMKYMKRLVETQFLVKEARKGDKTREVYYKLNPTIEKYGGYE